MGNLIITSDLNLSKEKKEKLSEEKLIIIEELKEIERLLNSDTPNSAKRAFNKINNLLIKSANYKEKMFSLENELYSYDSKLNDLYKALKEQIDKGVYDWNKIQTIGKYIYTLPSEIEEQDLYETDLYESISQPLPEAWKFPYCNNENIFLNFGLPTIIGATPGVGKSSIMINLAYHYYKEKDANQWVYSLEMKTQQIVNIFIRIQELKERKKAPSIKEIYENHKEYKLYTDSMKKKIRIFSNDKAMKPIEIDTIEKQLDEAYIKGNLPSIVYIDYLQKIDSRKPNYIDARDKINDIVFRLTQLAKKYNFILVLFSQANRTSNQNRNTKPEPIEIDKDEYNSITFDPPPMENLKESSSIEEVAGLCITLGRYKLFTKKEENEMNKDILRLSIEKNRFGASGMYYNYWIDKSTSLIEGFCKKIGKPQNK